ncbi:Tetrathionate reductase subunit B precursor [Posidoniimonas polymericola]|uniref:Tetrathionate reductase subunit B n=1 Tax=Posidoniimonas polymericola TaxID=2528002 RepID=A0A5C5YU58_9BACT|nr:TAT-variant-translocated molybdopterin oxidoreductase [Posidoniimonas polymericola]TWT78193.1 Tetrathionate reductase subunit B precursor [Posidoniimonas polymericola]
MSEASTPTRTRSSSASPYWRSIDELQQTPEFMEFVHREFPQAADEIPAGISRRRWMQLMSASFALAAAQGCRWKTEQIATFSDRPEGYVPGSITKYATSIDWAGAPRHLLVSCYDGRPIKVDGNPNHPAVRGGSDTFSQAATLALYDPDRQQQPIDRSGKGASNADWSEVDAAIAAVVEKLGESGGGTFAVLKQPTHSVSLDAALKAVLEKLPQAKVYEYAPLARDSELAGAELAFGERVRTRYNLQGARVIACFDSDLLKDHPESLALARDYADGRDPDGDMNRLYCVESQFSMTGGCADHRLPLRSSAIPAALAKLLSLVESGEVTVPEGEQDANSASEDQFLAALAEDLLAHKGAGVVAVGGCQSAEAFALAHKINDLLGNAGETVLYAAEPAGPAEVKPLADLAGEIAARRVDTLLILGGNPIYDAPVDLDFEKRLGEVATSIHLSPYDDETSRLCTWSLPETHPFESWGDTVGWDGAVGVQQPLIDPLLGGRSAIELLCVLAGVKDSARDFVRAAVAEKVGGLDDSGWDQLVQDGFLADSAAEAASPGIKDFSFESVEAPEFEVVLTASESTYDGRLANNGWLQETPDFITKLTWDNAALVNPATAKAMNVKQGQMITVTVGGQSLDLPVYIQPGQAQGSIGVALGYGRTAAGRVGGLLDESGDAVQGLYPDGIKGTWFPLAADPVGFDAYQLRTTDGSRVLTTDVSVKGAGGSYTLATTQDHHAIDVGGLEAITERSFEFIREASQEFYQEHKAFAQEMGHHIATKNLWKEPTFSREDASDDVSPNLYASTTNNAWGMAIDLNKCIGCNACTVACQAENNIPVVGKDMVSRGREMHWIRVDRYFRSEEGGEFADSPTVVHQPVACQQCETAPCEQVCPVAATVHSAEGLNDMVYNRCVGTRYCANNCPFKVRRFNYFHYNWELERGDWPAGKINEPKVNANRELQRLVMNPEVTIRHRGVMEKCTYCTQRISHARIDAKVEGREMVDGDVVTACQEACPTRAIEFGDLNDKDSKVAQAHASGRAYGMLDGLHLRPRTQYLARIRNPHAALKKYLPAEPTLHAHGGHGEGGHGADEHGAEGHNDADHGDAEHGEAGQENREAEQANHTA